MSLKSAPIQPVPEGTARVAKAAFRKGTPLLKLRDELGAIFADEDFADLFPKLGQPGLPPWRLALITLLQFCEDLPDRRAAEAVRARKRLAAWAGVAPGNHESAGRRKGAAARKGNVFLEATLFAAASAAVKTKGSHYRDKYHQLRARRGPVRALVAVAPKLLIAAFHMLRTGGPFRELGEDFLDRVSRKRSTTKLVRRLAALGYDVLLVPKAA